LATPGCYLEVSYADAHQVSGWHLHNIAAAAAAAADDGTDSEGMDIPPAGEGYPLLHM
jgi:hypothetical protein